MCAEMGVWTAVHTPQLFEMLRALLLHQRLLTPDGTVSNGDLRYSLLSHPVCRRGFAELIGVGWHPRLDTLLRAALAGQRSAPVDQRFLTRPCSRPSSRRSEVFTYLMTLYHSQAETMPHDEDAGDSDEDNGDSDPYSEAPQGKRWPTAAEVADSGPRELRHLPPGSIFELWRQYTAVTAGPAAGFRLFWEVFHNECKGLLAFRGTGMHSVCSVCTKHKLLLKQLAGDSCARLRQRALYDRHLAMQYEDRKVYWAQRARSRTAAGATISLILDGMDQAKFGWPRAPFMGSHEWDNFARLHCLGLICHGYFSALTVGHADTFKGGSTTVDVLCFGR